MDLEIIIQNEVRKTNTMWYHLYVESKIWHKWTFLQNRIMDKKTNVVAKGVGVEEGWSGRLGLADVSFYI